MKVPAYGLIGHPLGHSLSPFVHAELLRAAGLPGTYELIDLPPEQLPEQLPVLLEQMAGFSCTIPYKEAIIPYLDQLDPTAAAIGAVNTVWRRTGYNTDLAGFLADCPSLAGHRVLILGAGGVSRTLAYAAAAAGAEIAILARRPQQAEALGLAVHKYNPNCQVTCPADLAGWLETRPFEPSDSRPWVLLNGTPAGMWPNTAGMPFPAELLGHFSFVYDTIFNPTATRLVLAARTRGVPAKSGIGMLVNQAAAAQCIWHPGFVFTDDDCSPILQKLPLAILEHSPLTIILIGYMGSGKTTVGRLLADFLSLPFVDLDHCIEKAAGQTIPEIFANQGEPVFRQFEREQLAGLLHNGQSQVLATGGGALLDPAAEAIVRDAAALTVYLDVPLDILRQRVGDGKGRPMVYAQGEDRFTSLYEQRRPRYQALADLRVEGECSPDIAAAVMAGLGL